jgi:DNA-directed RNA polymerase II subunit RPB2
LIFIAQNLSTLCHIRIGHASDNIRGLILKDPGTKELLRCSTEDLHRDVKIFVNGALLGTTTTVDVLIEDLWRRRQCSDIAHDTSITYLIETREISVTTDAGNPARPVFVLRNIHQLTRVISEYRNFPNGLWKALLEEGIVQYMDKEEERMYKIAFNVKHMIEFPSDNYTHIQIHPCDILGLCANIIPFPEHNQSPRNMYSSAMMKQRMSLFATNFFERMDTISYVLTYGQEPLVQTYVDQLMHGNELPSEQNPIVAVMTYGGYNIEDAIMVNKGSIERGLFRGEIFRSYRDEETSNTNAEGARFHKVDPRDPDMVGVRDGNYGTLEEDGVPAVRTILENNDAIIGKVVHTLDGKRDLSTFAKTDEKAQVSKVVRTVGRDDRNTVIVQTRATRIPEIGDKFASRHGQKGVIGMILPEEDMPFTVSALPGGSVRPDFIVNPHGFPSRMTVAQQLEMILGKAICAGDGKIGDGTAFQSRMQESDGWVQTVYDELKKHGYQPHGKERMMNGMTGELMEASIFVCPVQYQRLRHMVKDKMHTRSVGPCTLLTRQPTEGRSRDGGLRFGEMEGNNVISHGAAAVLKDRLFEQSDMFRTPVCTKCGLLAEDRKSSSSSSSSGSGSVRGSAASVNSFYCRNCDRTDTVVETFLPYAFKLLLQEIYALHICPRLEFSDGVA